MLTVGVLGPLEVRRDDEPVPIPTGKTTEVLVRLALEAGTSVRAERIIDDLWADPAAKNTLQSKVSQLRRALGADDVIATRHGGYALRVGPDCVDALRVLELSSTASRRRAAGDAAGALQAATQGLTLFRGEPLVDAGDGDWLRPHRARLDEVRLGLAEDRLHARTCLAPGPEVIGELETLVRQHPLREALWQLLITALYRSGRQADALAAYGRVRQLLVDELGIEPGPELRELEAQVLAQSPRLQPNVAPDRPSTGGNLPALSAPLVGRAGELDDLCRGLEHRRLLSLIGPAGVGKTRLAIEAARRIASTREAWLVRLDAVDPAASIERAVCETLRLANEAALIDRLSATDTLLVLDNCEHLVGPVAAFAGRVLDATARCRILVTSQRPLGLGGEVVYWLDPLPLDDAVALFTGHAQEMRRQFVADAQAAATIATICTALDGLPLAIELAAARVRSLSVAEIARRLDDRFTLLRDPTSSTGDRRRALGAAIAWSYELLFPDDQRGLWALSCFTGGAELRAAEYVLDALDVPVQAALDVIDRLVDRSLVNVDTAADGSVRYRLLDSIRAFAADRLDAAGCGNRARAAHARWFAARAAQIQATVRSSAQRECLDFVRAERGNVDAALAWCAEHDPSRGLDIANGLGWTWVVLGDGVAGAGRMRAALGAVDHAQAEPGITGLLLTGWLEASAGDVTRAERELDEALGAATTLGDEALRADAWRHLAFLHLMQARPALAHERAVQSVAVYRALGKRWHLGGSLLLAASASMMSGDAAAAVDAAHEAVELIAPIEDSWVLVHAEAILGAIAQGTGRFDDAAKHLARAAAEAERLGFVGQAAYHLTRLGRVQQQAGDTDAAADTLQRSIDAASRCGDQRMGATARINLARVLRPADPQRAVALLHETDAWYRSAGGGDGALLTRCLLASMDGTAHDLDALLDDARAARDEQSEVLVLDLQARRSAAADDFGRARRLLTAADTLAQAAPHAVSDLDRVDAHATRARLAADR